MYEFLIETAEANTDLSASFIIFAKSNDIR